MVDAIYVDLSLQHFFVGYGLKSLSRPVNKSGSHIIHLYLIGLTGQG